MRYLISLAENVAIPRLFHGCCAVDLQTILQDGLIARITQPKSGKIRRGVYLTDDFHLAGEYGFLACDRSGSPNAETAVLEILTHLLNPSLLQPDDYDLQDAIQGGEIAGSEPIDSRLEHLTRWDEADWRLSLAVTHQVFYAGSIPPSALRVV